jgi:alanine dehydrogenase
MTTTTSKDLKNGPFDLICEWEVKGLPTPVVLLYDRGEMILVIWGAGWRGAIGDDAYIYFARAIVMPSDRLWSILFLAKARFLEYKAWRISNGR